MKMFKDYKLHRRLRTLDESSKTSTSKYHPNFNITMAYKKKKPKKKISSNAATLTDVQKCINYLKKRYVFRYNTVKKRPEFHRKHEKIFRDVEDEDFRSIRIEMAKDTSVNFQCSRETLKDIIWSNSSWYNFDPFKEWLKSLPKWDGNYHIRELSSTVKTDDDKYFDWCLRKWLVGFVAGLNGKEAVNQECLFLCGKQGLGKSTWIEHLLPQELHGLFVPLHLSGTLRGKNLTGTE